MVGNARGDVFFHDTASDASHPNPGLKRWRDGQITLIGSSSKPSGGTGYFGLTAERSNAAGDLACTAAWTEGVGYDTGHFVHWREGLIRLVMRLGEQVPGLPGTTYGAGRILAMTDDGAVIFMVSLRGSQGGHGYFHWKDGQTTLIARTGMVPHGAPDMNWYPLGHCVADNGAVLLSAQNGSGGQGARGLWYWEPGLAEARVVCVGNPTPKIKVEGYGMVDLVVNGNTLNGDLGIGSNSGVCGILNRHGKLALGGRPYGLMMDVRTLALGSPPSVIQGPQSASVARGAREPLTPSSMAKLRFSPASSMGSRFHLKIRRRELLFRRLKGGSERPGPCWPWRYRER